MNYELYVVVLKGEMARPILRREALTMTAAVHVCPR